jgi:hypothetical protein
MKTLTVLILSFLATINVFGQWIRTAGPEGGGGYGIVKQRNTLFAATFNGIYSSVDDGNTWLLSGLSGRTIYRMISNDSVLLASCDDTLFRSTDNGSSWVKVWTTSGTLIQSIAEHQSAIYLSVREDGGGSEYGGVYKSTDDGTSWQKLTTSSDFSYVRTLVSTGNYLIAITFSNGIWRSLSGTSWQNSTIHISQTPFLWTARSYNGILYAAGEPKVFLSSTNQGATWDSSSNVGIRDFDPIYDIQPISNNKILALTQYSDTIYVTTDRGETWEPIHSPDLPTNSYGLSSKYSLSLIASRVYCLSEIGPFSAETSALTWKYIGSGIKNASVRSLASSDNTLFASSLSGIFRTTDDGSTWTYPEDSSQLRWRSIWGLHSVQSVLYAQGEEGVWKQSGGSWTKIDTNFTYDLTSSGDTIVWAIGYGGLAFSTDGGSSIASANGTGIEELPNNDTSSTDRVIATGSAFIAQVGVLTEDTSSPGTYYLVYRLYRSGNGMKSWQLVDSANINEVAQFLKAGNTIFAGTYYNGLFRSDDDGRSWQRDTSISQHATVNALYSTGGFIFISLYEDDVLADGIYRSGDGGASWTFVGDGANVANAFVSYDGFLFIAVPDAGVWKRSLDQLTVGRDLPAQQITSLYIFPNPAGQSIKLQLSVDLNFEGSIDFIDETGNIVLEQKMTFQSGQMENIFSISTLREGMYYCKLIDKSGATIARTKFIKR